MNKYIRLSAAVAAADYAADEHPYDTQTGNQETSSEYNRGWNAACDYLREEIERIPYAPVTPVVRCIECAFYRDTISAGKVVKACHINIDVWPAKRMPGDFCSFGERKD